MLRTESSAFGKLGKNESPCPWLRLIACESGFGPRFTNVALGFLWPEISE